MRRSSIRAERRVSSFVTSRTVWPRGRPARPASPFQGGLRAPAGRRRTAHAAATAAVAGALGAARAVAACAAADPCPTRCSSRTCRSSCNNSLPSLSPRPPSSNLVPRSTADVRGRAAVGVRLTRGSGARASDCDAGPRRLERLRRPRNGRRDHERCRQRTRADGRDLRQRVATGHPPPGSASSPLLVELCQGLLGDCGGVLSGSQLDGAVRGQRVRDLVERRSVTFARAPDAGGPLGQAVRDIASAVVDQQLVAKLLDRQVLGTCV